MNGLYLQYEKLLKVPTVTTKDGKKVNVLYIVDRNYERYVVALDHFRNFKGIQLLVENNVKNEEILIQGKRGYCSKLKKREVKN